MTEITSLEEYEAAINAIPADVRVEAASLLAMRSALRVAPMLGLEPDEGQFFNLSLTALRATLTSGVRGSGRTPDVDSLRSASSAASYSAASSAASYSAASSAASYSAASSAASYSAASSAASAASYSSASYSAASSASYSAASYSAASSAASFFDIGRGQSWTWEDRSAIGQQPLIPDPSAWHAAMPEYETQRAAFRKRLQDDGPHWNWWITWYDALYHGTPIDWDFCEQVALIDNDVWGAGPKAVGEAIRDLQDNWAAKRLALTETVAFSDAIQRYEIHPEYYDRSALIDGHFVSLETSLTDALQGNRLQPGCFEDKRLSQVLSIGRENLQFTEMTVARIYSKLDAKIGSGELPADDEITELRDICDDFASDLRANIPDLEASRAARVNLHIREGRIQPVPQLTEAEYATLSRIIADQAAPNPVVEIKIVLDLLAQPGVAEVTDEHIRTVSRWAKIRRAGKAAVVAAGATGAVVIGGTRYTAETITAIDEALPIIDKYWPYLAGLIGL